MKYSTPVFLFVVFLQGNHVNVDQAREKYIRIGEMGKALREEKIESLNR